MASRVLQLIKPTRRFPHVPKRYYYKGQLYVADKSYTVDAEMAEELLALTEDDAPIFEEVRKTFGKKGSRKKVSKRRSGQARPPETDANAGDLTMGDVRAR